MSKAIKNKNIYIIIITGIIAFVVGYILGDVIGFGSRTGTSSSKWVGVYYTDSWRGHGATITLNYDGTCELPEHWSDNDNSCTYEVRDGYVYFNGETDANHRAAIGETGLIYWNGTFTKLK